MEICQVSRSLSKQVTEVNGEFNNISHKVATFVDFQTDLFQLYTSFWIEESLKAGIQGPYLRVNMVWPLLPRNGSHYPGTLTKVYHNLQLIHVIHEQPVPHCFLERVEPQWQNIMPSILIIRTFLLV
jgi:hypothetical protein